MNRPDLYVFSISHYCEKARFALDWLGIAYALHHLAPGPHVQATKELGASGSGLPVLVDGDLVVQGSGAILDWADAHASDPARRLAPEAALAEECAEIERRLDDVVGVHVRRYYYSESMVEYPDTVRPLFTSELAEAERRLMEENWGTVRKLMMASMDLGREQWQESREIVEGELDWLDARLADGRRYLLGDRFSRADVTAASLLAPIAMPEEHPSYGSLAVPPRSGADLVRWSQRPVVAWVRKVYEEHR